MRIKLLLLRYLIYFSILAAPYINPAVVVMYDFPMIFIFFMAVPFEMYLAFRLSTVKIFRTGFFSLKGRELRRIYLAVFFPLLLLMNFSYSSYLLYSFSFSAAAFFTTYFLFRYNAVFLSFLEALFYFIIYSRLIGFSSSLDSENLLYSYITSLYFVMLLFSWFLVSFYYYKTNRIKQDDTNRSKTSDFKREYLFLLLFFAVFSLVVFIFLPDGSKTLDFVLNFSNEKALPEGGAAGDDGEEGNLKGVPSDRWGNRSRRSSSGSRQYAVMVVASKKGEIYSAWDYLGRFDSVKGFLFSEDENLNSLKSERFIENWINPEFPYDSGRDIVRTFFLSAIPERSVPYLPFLIEPTIYDTSTSPFSYSYSASSFISVYNAENVPDGWELLPEEKEILKKYLYSEIDTEYRSVFLKYIDDLDLKDLPPGKRIQKILRGFEKHQYEIGYDENTSVEKLSKFLSGSLTGDCTEFANTAAILGRLAGIPSRVVRGYLASKNLQTPSHTKGILELQKNIDVLKEYPTEELLLVTTAHKHAWVQFYLSEYGWIDFESTGSAIPPTGMNMNDAQVVVPIIRTIERGGKKDYVKGFLIVVKLLAVSAALLVLLLYLFKYSKMIYLLKAGNSGNREYAVKRYRYILLKFFAAGYPVKKKYLTPVEYSSFAYSYEIRQAGGKLGKHAPETGQDLNIKAEDVPAADNNDNADKNDSDLSERIIILKKLSVLFTEILYRENYSEGEFEILKEEFDNTFKDMISCFKRAGVKEKIVSAFSLKGVFFR